MGKTGPAGPPGPQGPPSGATRSHASSSSTASARLPRHSELSHAEEWRGVLAARQSARRQNTSFAIWPAGSPLLIADNRLLRQLEFTGQLGILSNIGFDQIEGLLFAGLQIKPDG